MLNFVMYPNCKSPASHVSSTKSTFESTSGKCIHKHGSLTCSGQVRCGWLLRDVLLETAVRKKIFATRVGPMHPTVITVRKRHFQLLQGQIRKAEIALKVSQ